MRTYVYLRSYTDCIAVVKQCENEDTGTELDHADYPVPSSEKGMQAAYRYAWNLAEAEARKIGKGKAQYTINPFRNAENSDAAWVTFYGRPF